MYHLLVIPDWRGCNKTSKGTLTKAAKVQLRAKIARMANKLKKPRGEVSIKQKRLANKYSSIAFDKAIQVGLGKAGLVEFKPPRPARPVCATLKRSFTKVALCPPEDQIVGKLNTTRCCWFRLCVESWFCVTIQFRGG